MENGDSTPRSSKGKSNILLWMTQKAYYSTTQTRETTLWKADNAEGKPIHGAEGRGRHDTEGKPIHGAEGRRRHKEGEPIYGAGGKLQYTDDKRDDAVE